MQYTKNHFSKKPKTDKKKKDSVDSIQNVISLRINDEEKKTLEKLTKSTSKSVSDIMKEAFHLWLTKRRKLCLD